MEAFRRRSLFLHVSGQILKALPCEYNGSNSPSLTAVYSYVRSWTTCLRKSIETIGERTHPMKSGVY